MRPSTSPPRPLSGLASLLGAPSGTSRAPLAAVSGVTIDSRRVRRGDLYVALPGATVHGAGFSAQALAAGACAILTDEAGRPAAVATGLPVLVVPDPRAVLGQVAAWVYGHPAADVTVIGVTGTSGKSTSTFLLEAGLRAAGHRTGLIGGVEIHAGGLRFTPELTTPEASDLHGLFALMREQGVTAAAMEVSSHALALGRVDGVRYDVALFTNLSQDHLDFHRDLDDYFAAKARLFTPERSRAGVVNIDDAHGRALLGIAGIPMTTFSAAGAPEADWRAADVRLGPDGSEFRVVGPGGVEEAATVALPGPFNVANALGAIVALVEAGVPLRVAVAGVGTMTGVPGRMERVPGGDDFTAIVDYSHKPGAVESVLRSLREVAAGRLIVVLGCGGDRDRGKRPMMGESAARLADVAILTSDNPRSEDPLRILAEMMDGVLGVPQDGRAHVIIEPDRAAAIDLAIGQAGLGDVVVVAGKGHEQGQYVGDKVLPFDDRQVVADAIARRRNRTRRRSTHGE
ncbi:UDP-N-acetylmuramoyl-L-alanyl-D-glutamate--2,6-diaminopimelate ligase [Streptosporangium becharense]|uniref:UDP-N-acetylmuramoyl-L-alanyl-D-glutamate--2,6-diaminopimelate ligase n=1 Tax=Streptosporangium becharense TaxID=1816182 RepID=A0A7W9ICT0_9ACTN|nr:UDP-N-acetylmuramoyl-L-alanyl-D-glutamate--2,6-diaminopimelate ligase [Streptosporangium becharense]MBB2912858.1 UDP-N-acetylmuramoyl-L-alanyl-D-glutamate--2,6-diaminopimelate ligase [Streptosporangium becharense]MBB5818317.1 UDP-N-acetylmuramoyl-L-alanyl-D-glutamate--2,6-diaminopimelate ligase [Streptosporangium becharense]